MDFTTESDHLHDLTTIILHLLKYMEDNVVCYPMVMLVYTTLVYGVEVDGEMVGGLLTTLEVIDEAMESLDLELDFEAPSYKYPADYQI